MRTIARRLARLEAIAIKTAELPLKFRYGFVKPLPADYVGERHLVVVKQLESRSPNTEWCEFEERPGLEPESEKNNFTVCFVSAQESCR
jgi:hypothetical protein